MGVRVVGKRANIIRIFSILVIVFVSVVFYQQTTVRADGFNNVSGEFTDGSGGPVVGAVIEFHSVNNETVYAQTNENGVYNVNVIPDSYEIRISQTSTDDFANVNLYSDSTSKYIIDASSGNVTQNLQFDTVLLNVNFVDRNNQPLSDRNVSIDGQNYGGATALALNNPNVKYSGGLDVNVSPTAINGQTTAIVLRGIEYKVCATDPATFILVCEMVTPTSNSSTITLSAPEYHTVSGKFTDGFGGPVIDAQICLYSVVNKSDCRGVTTDGDGDYSINVIPDIYEIRISANTNSLSNVNLSSSSPNRFLVDASINDVTQDLQFDSIVLNINFYGSNGQPIPNANVSVDGQFYGGKTILINGRSDILYSGGLNSNVAPTDSNGQTTAVVLRGLTYKICSTNPSALVEACTMLTPTTDVANVVLSASPTIASPTNLSIPSPTSAPHLTWDMVTDAIAYNIYRGGSLIGASDTNSYIDSTVAPGTYTYYVKATGYGGSESGSSNEVSVEVVTIPVGQTISFITSAPAPGGVGGVTYTPVATSTSGLPVTISVDSTSTGVCSINGGVVSFLSAGTCKLNGNQPGNANYNAAMQVQQSFTVKKNADVSVSISCPLTTYVSATISCSIVVTNNGPAKATGVNLGVNYPASKLSNVTAVVTGSGTLIGPSGGLIYLIIGQLGPGTSVSLNLHGTATALGTATIQANVASNSTDPNILNGLTSVSVNIL